MTKPLEERIKDVLHYCEPHIDQMWASVVVGMLLDCDFREAAHKLRVLRDTHEIRIKTSAQIDLVERFKRK